MWTSDGSPVVSEIAVQRLPSSIAIDPTGRRAHVADTLLDGLTILNTDTLVSVGRLPLGTVDSGLAYDGVSASKRLYHSTSGQYFFCTNNGTSFTYGGGTMSAGWKIRVGLFDDNAAADLFLYNEETGNWYEVTDSGNFSGKWSGGWQVFVMQLNADSRSDVLLYSDSTGQWFQCLNTGLGSFGYTTGQWARGLRIITERRRLP